MTYKMPKKTEDKQRKVLQKNKTLTPKERAAAKAILDKAKAERESNIKKPSTVKKSVKATEKAEKLSMPLQKVKKPVKKGASKPKRGK